MTNRVILGNSEQQINDLLKNSPHLFQILTENSSQVNEFVAPSSNMVVGNESRYSFACHLSNFDKYGNYHIEMDHSYARPGNWRPESSFLRPTKTLFMPKTPARPNEEEIDIMGDDENTTYTYDKTKAVQLMEECENHAKLARMDEPDVDWEESVSRANWNITQTKLFNGMVNLLNADHLARLAYKSVDNEPIARRTAIDKSVARLRKLLAVVEWDPRYTQWLHQLLIENLSTSYLAAYIDILQTLRTKLPAFVDKLMATSTSSRLSLLSYESLFPLLKKQWDPTASTWLQDKPKKLPLNPLLVVVPSTPISSKRMLKWINLLSNLATVITIPSNYAGAAGNKTSMITCLDHMFVMTRNKIQDLRLDYPGRNIVLVGFGFGATLALQIAQVEQVLCVISLSFSMLTAEGKRGEPDDNLLELQCPVLFVIGQCSSTAMHEDIEDLRERMRVETGLIVVGSADENLRVTKKKKLTEGITQSVVDRCIADEIGEFIGGLILSPFPPQIRQSPINLTTDGPLSRKLKQERKRYNSNTSSVDSEPPSPTPKITRPAVGRPPGSKKKLENKWVSGITSPSNSPPHQTLLNTPDTSSNDSNIADKLTENNPVIKKIKTLKPMIGNQEKNSQHIPQTQVNRAAGLIPGDYVIQTTAQKPNQTGIKVLENLKINPGQKYITTNKVLDMAKLSGMTPKSGNSSSIVLFPDGKIKNVANTKSPGRFITSKKQLLANRPPKPIKKLQYLPPPTNLTSQDIMDLPIIFADDNQIIDTNLPSELKGSPTKLVGNKFMVINKPSFIIQSSARAPVAQSKPMPKYTKIILSTKKVPEVKKPEPLDLEQEIAASKVYKTIDGACDTSQTVAAKRPAETPSDGSEDESPTKMIKLDPTDNFVIINQ